MPSSFMRGSLRLAGTGVKGLVECLPKVGIAASIYISIYIHTYIRTKTTSARRSMGRQRRGNNIEGQGGESEGAGVCVKRE